MPKGFVASFVLLRDDLIRTLRELIIPDKAPTKESNDRVVIIQKALIEINNEIRKDGDRGSYKPFSMEPADEGSEA
jgi:hypothetical protein